MLLLARRSWKLIIFRAIKYMPGLEFNEISTEDMVRIHQYQILLQNVLKAEKLKPNRD